jgi:hypothetical protein
MFTTLAGYHPRNVPFRNIHTCIHVHHGTTKGTYYKVRIRSSLKINQYVRQVLTYDTLVVLVNAY